MVPSRQPFIHSATRNSRPERLFASPERPFVVPDKACNMTLMTHAIDAVCGAMGAIGAILHPSSDVVAIQISRHRSSCSRRLACFVNADGAVRLHRRR